MLRNFLKRAILGALLGVVACSPITAFAGQGSYNYDNSKYAPSSTKDVAGPEARIRQVAEKISLIPGEDGVTMLPRGTAVDAVEIDGVNLTLKITLPEKTGMLYQRDAYTAFDVLREYFSDSYKIDNFAILARKSSADAYEPIDHFIVESQEVFNAAASGTNPDDWFEPNGPGPQPSPNYEKMYAAMRAQDAKEKSAKNISGQGSIGTTGNQYGPLTGITVYTYGGHGRTWDGDEHPPYWRWQRGFINNMLEDLGNTDAVEFFVPFLLNAGATVVPLRPVGFQNNEVLVDNPAATFTGIWSDSVSTRFYGSGVPYRYATTGATETATATYTPNIPAAGYYPVYTWVNYGSDRVPGQLYRIKTTGGESLIRVNHRRVGCGWVYLGTYYFYAGSNPATGSVVISNLNPAGNSTAYVAIADTIRFGNGMGTVNNSGGVSGYSRREESTVYWIQNGWGNGDTANDGIWDNVNTSNGPADTSADDEKLSFGAPPKMAAYMNRLENGAADAYAYAIYLGWHSNAGGGRGSTGLITTSTTVNQAAWAAMVSNEIDHDALIEDANWEYTWINRSATGTGAYGEISNYNFGGSTGSGGEMDATICEIAFHDSALDAALLRDPKVRTVVGRAAERAVVRYFNQYKAGPLKFLPEPPVRLRALNDGSGGVTLNWTAPLSGYALALGDPATGYRVYRSPDGLNFGNAVASATTSATITGLTPGQLYYFRVASTNEGGESMPSEVLAVKVRTFGSPKILIVNGYDRLDRFNDVDRGLSSPVDLLNVERNNSYNYVRQHGAAIAAAGFSFDSCSNEAVASGDVALGNYDVVDWILGEESSNDKTLDVNERTAVQNYLNLGGKNIFITGAETGYELEGQAVATSFYQTYLAADYVSDDGGSYQATGAAGSILAGIVMNFPASSTMYNVDYPDVINGINGSTSCATYTNGGSGGAAIQFSGGSPARKVVNFGFPFEAINSGATQNQVMAAVLGFFGVTESTETPTPSLSPSPSLTASPSPTESLTPSPSLSPSISLTASPSISPTPEPTLSPTLSPSLSPSPSLTASFTVSPSVSPTTSPTFTPIPSLTPTPVGATPNPYTSFLTY
ncbi:MAG: fibronectin type III domain-containing protein [Candidatus Sumerlaeota bacterium]